MRNAQQKRAWKIPEWGRRWGFGKNFTYALIARGDLESSKVGKLRIITDEQEERFRERAEAGECVTFSLKNPGGRKPRNPR